METIPIVSSLQNEPFFCTFDADTLFRFNFISRVLVLTERENIIYIKTLISLNYLAMLQDISRLYKVSMPSPSQCSCRNTNKHSLQETLHETLASFDVITKLTL